MNRCTLPTTRVDIATFASITGTLVTKLTIRVSIYIQDNAFNYDKGVLAEILEPIMGKGLIPADLETWKPRRRAVVPAFHKAWLEAMVNMFGACTQETIRSLDALTAGGQVSQFSFFK